MIVWKTEDPKQIASFEEWHEQRKAWADAAHAIAEEVTGARPFMSTRTGSFSGLPWDGDTEPPEGWKLGRGRGPTHIVPDGRRKVGKDWSKRIAALPKVSEEARCDGQPGSVFHVADKGTYFHMPRYHRFTDDGPLFMVWTCDCGTKGEKEYSITENVDASIWQSVKLSEFYAEVEAEKERVNA